MKEMKKPFVPRVQRLLVLLVCLILVLALPLKALAGQPFSGGEGSEGNPYLISSAADLKSLADAVNSGETFEGKHFKLTTDLDYSNEALKDGSNFTVIGSLAAHFQGNFDGNNKTISGVVLSKSMDHIGFVGCLGTGGVVKNLVLMDVSITGQQCVGAVVGCNYGHVENCSVTGTVEGVNAIGGIVGINNNSSKISNSTSNVTVTGTQYVGGVAGVNYSAVESCTNNDDVTGNRYVGGVVGYDHFSAIKNSINYGKVKGTGTNFVGGISGYTEFSEILDNQNYGNVQGANEVGGIVGYNHGGTIRANTNHGLIEGTNNGIGGIVGYNLLQGLVQDNTNHGEIQGKNWIGGIVGLNQSECTIDNNVNNGTVQGEISVGGIAGVNDASLIKNSNNFGWIVGEVYEFGGIVGSNVHYAIVDQCLNRGRIQGPGDYKGGIVGVNEGIIKNSVHAGEISGPGDFIGGIEGYNSGGATYNCISIDTHPDEKYPQVIEAVHNTLPEDITLEVTLDPDPDSIITLQWYHNATASYSGATPIDSATSDTYTIPQDLAVGTYYFFCRIVSTDGEEMAVADTNFVHVLIEPAAPAEPDPEPTDPQKKLPETGAFLWFYYLLGILLLNFGVYCLVKRNAMNL